jgi:soluble lytic murein transglycosylase-like protein
MKRLLAILAICGIAVFFVSTQTIAEEVTDTYLSTEIQNYIYDAADKYFICPELIMAIVETESSGDPNAQNGSCIGLMQVSAPFHQERMERLGVTDLRDPAGNILVGTDYLAELAARYDDLPVVLMLYNGDSNALDAEDGFVSDYAKKIINRSIELERLHDK